jgi:hypothetical protein
MEVMLAFIVMIPALIKGMLGLSGNLRKMAEYCS